MSIQVRTVWAVTSVAGSGFVDDVQMFTMYEEALDYFNAITGHEFANEEDPVQALNDAINEMGKDYNAIQVHPVYITDVMLERIQVLPKEPIPEPKTNDWMRGVDYPGEGL